MRGGKWAFNDPCSLSGYLSMLRRVPTSATFFGNILRSGSHMESMRLVAAGEADGAAIDSNALAWLLRRDPALADQLRILESWGPYPIQPIVATTRLPLALTDRMAEALCSMHQDGSRSELFQSFGVVRFAPITDHDYAGERAALHVLRPEPAGIQP